jgi:uncharacterized protein YcfJ
MKLTFKIAAIAATTLFAAQAMAQITFYEHENYRGRALTYTTPIASIEKFDRAGSVVVERGRWEVCERPRFEGRCAVLRRGGYESLRGTGLEWQISSLRPASRRNYDLAPAVSTQPVYQYRQRPNERTHEVPVTWSRAVMGPPSQRCWVEREPVQSSSSNVGGAVAGAVIGGILGHQVGGGSGRDAATAVGAVAGAAIGSNVAGGPNVYATRDVQRCQQQVSGTPAFWEVAYNFRGAEHRVQMSTPPNRTILVNERGEPRQ